MAEEFYKREGLRVVVERVVHVPDLDAPADRPHPFVYFITIINDSAEALWIVGRKWILKDVEGDTMVVEGEGVVGEKPHLKPSERFSYNSYHVVKCDTKVTGTFFGVDGEGRGILVSIPEFELNPKV